MPGVFSTMSDVTISSGQTSTGLEIIGELTVLAGGIVTSSLITYGGPIVSSGMVFSRPPAPAAIYGYALSDTVADGSTQTVLGGGLAAYTTVSGEGVEIDASGGTDTYATVSGRLTVSGGKSISGLINSYESLSAGGSSVDETFVKGAFGASQQVVYQGGVALSTTLVDGEQILSGGSSIDTMVESGSELTVSSGGVATSATISGGAIGVVFSGGEFDHPTVENGGVIIVLPGGLVVDPTLEPGGSVLSTGVFVVSAGGQVAVYPGVASGLTISANSTEFVLGNGSSVSNTIQSGGQLYVSGGVALEEDVERYATAGVYASGLDSASIINGTETVFAQGTVISDTVYGTQTIESGATADSILVYVIPGQSIGVAPDPNPPFFGQQIVSSGGAEVGVTLSGAQYQVTTSEGSGPVVGLAQVTIEPGGSATDVVVEQYGFLHDGGSVSGLTIDYQGVALLTGGITYTGALVEGGTLSVGAGTTTSLTLVTTIGFDAGTEVVYGSSVSATIDGNPSLEEVYGVATGAMLVSGGELTVEAGGLAQGTVIGGGSEQTVSAGGTARGTIDNTSEIVYGVASGTVVGLAGANQEVDGGITFDTTLTSQTVQYVNGGVAYGTVAMGTALLNATITDDAMTVGAVLSSGGEEILDVSSATASGTIVSSGGHIETYAGTTLSDIVSNGGVEIVLQTGVASGTIVDSGGTLSVGSGGTASALTVGAGGFAVVSSGGMVSGATIDSGGVLEIRSGESFTSLAGVTVQPGGELLLEGIVVASGGMAIVPGPVTGTTNYSGVTVSSGGIIDYDSAVVSSGGTLVVDSGATAYGATLDVGATLVIASGGTVSGLQNEGSANVSDDGTLVFVDGDTVFSANISGSGVVDYEGSGTLVLSGQNSFTGGVFVTGGGKVELFNSAAPGSGPIVFTGDPTVQFDYLPAGGVFLNPISGFATGNELIFNALPYDPGLTSATFAGTTLTVTDFYNTEFLTLDDVPAGGGFTVSNLNNTVAVTETGGMVACYCAGTLIQTPDGERAAETLAIGDAVVTASGAMEPIRWLGRRSYSGRFLARQAHLLPIVIAAGALGHGLPRRDLRISPEHAMLLDDVLVPARCLLNGTTIRQQQLCEKVEYVHIELARHDVILAEGAASETFLDDDSRGVFHNAAEFARLYPGLGPQLRLYCAPRVMDGYALEAIRRRLNALSSAMERSDGERSRARS